MNVLEEIKRLDELAVKYPLGPFWSTARLLQCAVDEAFFKLYL